MITHTLILKREELLQDIDNYSWLEGDVLQEIPLEVKRQIQDIRQEGNIELVARKLNLAYTECLEMLYPFIKSETTDEIFIDNTLHTPEEYIFLLSLPSQVSPSSIVHLKNQIHEYFVCRILGEWISTIYPPSTSYWEEKIDAIKSKINVTMSLRTKRLTRRLTPF